MATFRTGPDGRAVISDDNRVTVQAGDIDRGGFTARERAAGLNTIGGRRETRFNDGGRGGYERMNAPTREGTGYMSRSEFEAVSGMTDTNPYGRDGFFSRVFGIDPDKIDYTSTLGPRGIENVKRQAYDRFLFPFETTDAFGRPTMFADASTGSTRSGVQPGDLTRFGPAVEARQEGIAGLLQNTMLGSLMPKRARIPGYDANVLVPQMDLGGPQPGEGVDPQDRFPDGPPADVVRDPTATSLPTIEELTADREGRDIRRQEEQQQRTDREAQAVSAVLEMLQRATAPDAPEVDFPIGQSATGEDFPVTISDVLQGPTTRSIRTDVTVGDEAARLMGENRTRDEVAKQLVSQGVDPAEARSRANKAVYLTGDTANPRTSFEIGLGADPMGAAFESGLPSDLLRSYGLL